MLSNFFTCKPFLQQRQQPSPSEQQQISFSSHGDLTFSFIRSQQQQTTLSSHGSPSPIVRASVSQRDALQSQSSVVSDQNVPEGHKGLHGFLYGDGDANIHSSSESIHVSISDDGSSIVGLEDYVTSRDGMKFAGIFSVYNSQHVVQYVGFSRNVVLSLRSYLHRFGKDVCSFTRVQSYTDPAMITRSRLDEERQKWLSMCETLPPGNSVDKNLWENSSGLGVMSESEKVDYEEKKLKMRKAMGENLLDEVEGEEDDAKMRRLKLLQAVEGDDWSEVIDGQTKVTLNDGVKRATKASTPIVSPFDSKESTGPSSGKGLYSADMFELSLENVDMVLNDVRPYLIADGGNVEVVSTDNGVVALRLQGACGTCPSSTMTMKMGIERVLKEKFGDTVKEVVQVDQQQIGASIQAVDAHLEILRPAIHNYGGLVEVVAVEDGDCKVKFKGPPPISMGIRAAIKDKFPDITSVTLIDA